MNVTSKKSIALALALTIIAASARAEATLKVGDPAPKLMTGAYVQGQPVKAIEHGKAYIVEFWATWSGPCRQSIPHLNDIYTRYKNKGLVVIGQDCWETNDLLVAPLVREMGDKMTYRVALDDKTIEKHGLMAELWLGAADLRDIPSAFLIDTNGLIAWIGHPLALERKEEMIEQVLAGKFDIRKAAAEYAKTLKAEEDERQALAPAKYKMALMNKAMHEKKWEEALDYLAAAQKLVPTNQQSALKVSFDVNRFRILLSKGDYPAAYELAAKIGDDQKNDPAVLSYLARAVITEKVVDKPNYDLAEKLINRANEVTKEKDPGILETQAQVLFGKGQKDAAIRAETKAMTLVEPLDKAAMQKTLDHYKEDRPSGSQ